MEKIRTPFLTYRLEIETFGLPRTEIHWVNITSFFLLILLEEQVMQIVPEISLKNLFHSENGQSYGGREINSAQIVLTLFLPSIHLRKNSRDAICCFFPGDVRVFIKIAKEPIDFSPHFQISENYWSF